MTWHEITHKDWNAIKYNQPINQPKIGKYQVPLSLFWISYNLFENASGIKILCHGLCLSQFNNYSLI